VVKLTGTYKIMRDGIILREGNNRVFGDSIATIFGAAFDANTPVASTYTTGVTYMTLVTYSGFSLPPTGALTVADLAGFTSQFTDFDVVDGSAPNGEEESSSSSSVATGSVDYYMMLDASNNTADVTVDGFVLLPATLSDAKIVLSGAAISPPLTVAVGDRLDFYYNISF